MTRQLKRIGALVLQNFWWKVASLAIAVVLWALVASEPELATRVIVPLEYRNLPDDLEISSEPVGTITLELSGPSGELRGVANGGIHPEVVLDMSDAQPGERTFPISGANVRLSRGMHLVRANPSQAHFRFERRLERSVPVQVRITGEGRNGYVVARTEVHPRQLSITGPASRVARVAAAITDPVDVSSVVGSSEFRVNALVDDSYVRFESSPQVTVTVTMKKI